MKSTASWWWWLKCPMDLIVVSDVVVSCQVWVRNLIRHRGKSDVSRFTGLVGYQHLWFYESQLSLKIYRIPTFWCLVNMIDSCEVPKKWYYEVSMVFVWKNVVFLLIRGHVQSAAKSLVVGLEHFLFSNILGISSSQLTFIFFRGVGQPPTRSIDYP